MSNTPRKHRGKLNSKVAINTIRVESLPYLTFNGSNSIVPYGVDNIYPQRIINAIRKSPTAQGCVKRASEFIFGQGATTGETVVNRNGETLNDVIWQSIRNNYTRLGGLALHLNFNILGQVTEIFVADLQYLRKHRTLKAVDYGLWDSYYSYYAIRYVTLDLFGSKDPVEGIKEEGITKYNGQIFYFSLDNDIYPTSPLDSASISADFEKSAQIYPFANIKNGFSGNTVIKLPTLAQGEKAQKEVDTLNKNIEELHGEEKAGSSLVVPVPVDANGNVKDFKMIEHLSPTDVDGMFVNQNLKAEDDILKVYTMPKILLGKSDQGMFNEASFNDAFNYKNADTEMDRQIIERQFKKVLENSIFDVDGFELIPLEMKGAATTTVTVEGDDTTTEVSGISEEQLAAQATLKGSVGGVQGILQIQKEFAEGITSFGSAISILKLIYGFTEQEALDLLGNPQKVEEEPQESVVNQPEINPGNEVVRGLTGRQKQQLFSDIAKFKNGKITREQLEVMLKAYGLTEEDIEKMII